ncbi:MAG TPA: aldehyde dehydrogenase family protein, partial [Variovorax sp.]|nr:aldehyde dehydrogenase family protein [Variovorax sp.]
MNRIDMLINGEACQAGNGATFERRNPLDGGVATTAPAATVADAVAAVNAAAEAFKSWSLTGPGERRALLSKAADALEADRVLLERLGSLTDEEKRGFRTPFGRMEIDFDGFVLARLNEHAVHTWDVEVAFDPEATIAPEATAVVVD